MSDEEYEGWSNRETWAVALHINNDQGWQESVYEALRERVIGDAHAYAGTSDACDECGEVEDHRAHYVTDPSLAPGMAGEIIRENVEDMLYDAWDGGDHLPVALLGAIRDIGSLWRVDWAELGAAFLDDLND